MLSRYPNAAVVSSCCLFAPRQGLHAAAADISQMQGRAPGYADKDTVSPITPSCNTDGADYSLKKDGQQQAGVDAVPYWKLFRCASYQTLRHNHSVSYEYATYK